MTEPKKRKRSVLGEQMTMVFLALIMLLATACGVELADEPLVPDPESQEREPAPPVPAIGSIQQASYAFPAPWKIMLFPENQGSWVGAQAGQLAYCPFCGNNSVNAGYAFDDGEINILLSIGWPSSSCSRVDQTRVVCNGQVFGCPAQSCVTTPSLWQMTQRGPDRWGWWTGSDAPGNHGWRPLVPRQCNNGVPTIHWATQYPSGTILSCNYPMPNYWLFQGP